MMRLIRLGTTPSHSPPEYQLSGLPSPDWKQSRREQSENWQGSCCGQTQRKEAANDPSDDAPRIRGAGGAGLVALAAGRSALGAAGNRTLRFIARTDLRVLDPLWTTAYVSRNRGYIGFDTSFVLDSHDHRVGPLHL